jgi:HK97 family phage portal protein
MAHLAIWGNAYIGKYREQGEVAQLNLLAPERVRPEIIDGRLVYRYSSGTIPERLLSEADVVHVKGLSVDGLTGLSAVSQAARVLGLSDELVKHALSFFEKGKVRPLGVLRMPPDASENARQRMLESVKNESSPHQMLVVEGEVEYDSVQGKLDDAQFVEQRRLAAQEVCRVFRVPSHMLNAGSGGDSLTYSTTEQMSLDFVKYSLTPWLRRIELAISNDRDLCFQQRYVKFETDGLLRSDAKTRAEIYRLALDPIQGWMSRDEVRRLEDLPPEPQGAPQVAQLLNAMPREAVNGNGT